MKETKTTTLTKKRKKKVSMKKKWIKKGTKLN